MPDERIHGSVKSHIFFRRSKILFIPPLLTVLLISALVATSRVDALTGIVFGVFGIAFFSFFILIGFMATRITRSLGFTDAAIIIDKYDSTPIRITLESLHRGSMSVNTIRYKSAWNGIAFKEGKKVLTVIWEYEFDRDDWENVSKKLSHFPSFWRHEEIYLGLEYLGK